MTRQYPGVAEELQRLASDLRALDNVLDDRLAEEASAYLSANAGWLVDLDWAEAASSFPHLLPSPVDEMMVFGEPPITFYRGPRVYADALFWVTSSTEIHDHGFDGAFVSLFGSSLHCVYNWTSDGRSRDGTAAFGALALEQAEILHPGSARQIVSGPCLVHVVQHLGTPSATLVVRNYHTPGVVQQRYHLSGVALPSKRDLRWKRLLRVLRDTSESRLADIVDRRLRAASAAESVDLLASAMGLVEELPYERLLETVERCHPGEGQRLAGAAAESSRLDILSARCAALMTPEAKLQLSARSLGLSGHRAASLDAASPTVSPSGRTRTALTEQVAIACAALGDETGTRRAI